MLPQDLMGDINLESLFTGRPDDRLRDVLRAIIGRAASLLVEARHHRRRVSPASLPVLVPARLIDQQIARIRRADYRVFELPAATPSATTPIRLWWSVRTGRF
jgi:phytoene/squalene synthetase